MEKPLANKSDEIKSDTIHCFVSVGYAIASWLFFSTMTTVTMSAATASASYVDKRLPVLSDFDFDTFAFLVAATLGVVAIIHGVLGLKRLT